MRPSPLKHGPEPSPARSLPRSAAVLGALLSALAVVYAASLTGALISAVIFAMFYRQLAPASETVATAPVPDPPMTTTVGDQHRTA